MNKVSVVLFQGRSVPEDGASFWGAKNQRYLADMFFSEGFEVTQLSEDQEPFSSDVFLDRDLLFVNDQALIFDMINLKELLNRFLMSDEPGFSIKNLMYLIKKDHAGSVTIKERKPYFQTELPETENIFVTDVGSVEGYYKAQAFYRKKIIEKHFQNYVKFMDPDHTYIGYDVKIEPKTLIYPGCIIEGETWIGEESVIGPDCMIKDSKIGKCNTVIKSVIHDSEIGEHCNIGPFAYIRPGCVLSENVKVGDFVELKNVQIGERTKIPHHTYIGDATVGENTNIACGVITANYDGKNKHRTVIGKDAFIGCNVAMVAPVTINDGAYIAAGSTITKEVPPNAMAIAREFQVNKEDWVIKKGLQRSKKSE